MAYSLPPTNLTNGTQGIEAIIAYEATQIPQFMPMILLMVYVVIAGVGYFSQERREVRGNLAMWCAISGLITTTLSFILFLYNGLINIQTVVICVVVTILSVAAFLFSGREY